jgi:hypothetical protein
METDVVVKVVVIVIEDVTEGRVGADTDDEARRKFIVEAALNDADAVGITVFIEVVMEIVLRIAEAILIKQATPAIEVDVCPTDTATAAEIEACPGGHWRRLRHHIRGKGGRADRPKGECCN